MKMSNSIDDAIQAKGWKKKELAKTLNKHPKSQNGLAEPIISRQIPYGILKILNIKLINLSDSQAEHQ